MKINEHWIKELVDTKLSADDIGAKLTMAGLELDGLEQASGDFNDVVVAKIIDIAPHPDADKLRVCQVDAGDAEPYQVVCGAANARAGLTTVLAKVGAKLPNDLNIKKAKLRGVESHGMLCSESELGLATEADGIFELPHDLTVGSNLRDVFKLDDKVLELDLTPNRADCFSALGIARDLAAILEQDFSEPSVAAQSNTIDDTFAVEIQARDACPIYSGRLITGINADAGTPIWMKERLRRCGIRSLSAVVDIGNYVMLELGQPMHAFDADTLNGGITVRMAQKGEKLTLLDGQEVSLSADTLAITDQSGAVALAGIMGGLSTAVTTTTNNVFLESAYFTPETMAGKARQYGLHTDASMRFERGVDYKHTERAIERATQLIVEICGGQPGPLQSTGSVSDIQTDTEITLAYDDIQRRLGVSVAPETVENMLTRLGCNVINTGDSYSVVPPSWRFDLRIPVDLIEEVARLYGYDNIPLQTNSWQRPIAPTDEASVPIDRLRELLLADGYSEAITYSFVDEKTESRLATGIEPVKLLNPISADLAAMRTSLVGGLLNTCLYNLRRQQSDIALFETGLVFHQLNDTLEQRRKLAIVLTGAREREHWDATTVGSDFFDIKGTVEQLLQASGRPASYIWRRSENNMLHPGQSATISLDNHEIGFLGTLHPSVSKQFGFKQSVVAAELDLEPLLQGSVPQFSALSKFPSVRRDLSLLAAEEISAETIIEVAKSSDTEILRSAHIFDLYKGEGVKKGLKSIALGLILQGFSRTLEEQEINDVVDKTVSVLKEKLDVSIRE